MAHELVPKRENMSLFTAIETCCQHVADLKMSMNQSFNSLERDVGKISSSYHKIEQRMDALEKVVNSMSRCENHRHQCCDEVLKKISSVESLLKNLSYGNRSISSNTKDEESSSDVSASPIVLIRNKKPAQVSASLCLDSTVQVITLNSESDYPDGSWLGDETNPELRVRCPISQPNLLHINTFCQTPEKMAVTLLDYLFPREVLAISNLSGKGKHGKRQLDPLMIYGIRCHLVHKFNITERDWYRIKQNMDSKCRTAWRKKIKGLPLTRFKSEVNDTSNELQEFVSEDGEAIILTAGPCHMGDPIEQMETQVIHTTQGDIKVLHATPEQLVRIQETHHIQVLSEDLILPSKHEFVAESMVSQHELRGGYDLMVEMVETEPSRSTTRTRGPSAAVDGDRWMHHHSHFYESFEQNEFDLVPSDCQYVSKVLRDYPQMLVGADDDDGSSEQVLTIGDQSLTIPSSGMNIDDNEVDISESEYVEVPDTPMPSQVLNTDTDDDLTLTNANSEHLQSFVSIQ